MIDFSTRIQDATEYLKSQKDVDPESGEIFMPIRAARHLVFQQAKTFPGCFMVFDPAMCNDRSLR